MIRKEVHSRSQFSLKIGQYYFNKIVKEDILNKGNILSCFYMQKFSQARRIYIHYTNEYQNIQKLPLSK